jgi:response regulator NasT
MESEGQKPDPRWRVAILDDHERSRAALRAAIWAAGGEVVGEAVRCADVAALVRRTSPDVAVCAVGLPDGDGVEVARQLIEGGCPVVLFTSHTRQDLVDRARSAGVMSYLLKPLRAAELAPVLDLAVARFGETRDLRRSLEERKIIERAKGRLMGQPTAHGGDRQGSARVGVSRLRRAYALSNTSAPPQSNVSKRNT